MQKMDKRIKVAIVDHRLGNLFSVRHACRSAGMEAEITADKKSILTADAVILPGVGAYGDAMDVLHRLDLVSVLRDVVMAGKPLIGICLGMQLLMTESHEFGTHAGLGFIPGQVVRFNTPKDHSGRILKVPQIGWNRIYRKMDREKTKQSDPWKGTPLAGIQNNEYVYFVHSFYAQPDDEDTVLSLTKYGQIEFASSLIKGNIFATQFHPERSGPQGLKIYERIANMIIDRGE
jgi:glutamine amidotransferase